MPWRARCARRTRRPEFRPLPSYRAFHERLRPRYLAYTTVVVEAVEWFDPVIGDAESRRPALGATRDVASLPLHPGFASSWAELRSRLR